MIAASLGILILCICLLSLSQRDYKKLLDREYNRGFKDGAECIVEKRYLSIEEAELLTKKD